MERGAILQEGDLRRGEWRIRAIEHGLVVSPADAIGKRLQVTVPIGLPVPRVALESAEYLPEPPSR